MRALLTAVLLAVAMGWVGDAGAGEPVGTLVAAPRFVPVAGPVIATPGRLAWVTRRDDAVLDLWVAEPGLVAPRRVQRFSAASDEQLRAPRLSASPAVVLLDLRVTDRRARAIRTLHYSGAFGEPLEAGPQLAMRPAGEPWPGHAVAVTRGCASAEIRVLAGDDPAPAAVPATGCELRLRSPLRLRGERLRFGVACAGFRIDCSAAVTVRAGGRVIARGAARYNHATPPYAAASLRIGAAGRARSRAGTSARVTARLTDPSVAAADAVTRSVTVQLPAARR